MRNKRIFITGGTGFFGKSMMRHCPGFKENDIVILTPDPGKRDEDFPMLGENTRITFLPGDVRDFPFPDGDFDYIFHMATTSGKIIPDDEMRSVVIDGTRRVLEFAKRNPGLKNLLYVSSGAVYGNRYNLPVHEDFSCEPVNVYAKSKYVAEQLCLNSGVNCSIARCFAFVGEYLPLEAHFAIGNFMHDCLNHQPIVIKGDGTPVRTYLYAGDLAHWLWTILHRGEPGRIYNVGSDSEISIARLAETIRKVAGTDNQIKILTPPSDSPPQRYVPDIGRSRNELGLEIGTSLEEAIRMTLSHHINGARYASQSVLQNKRQYPQMNMGD